MIQIKKGVSVFGILILLMILMISVVSATTYYVAKGGLDGNDCSLGFACLTIQRGLDVASSGDIVIVGAGIYSEDLHVNNSGVILRSSGGPTNTAINGSVHINASADNFVLGGTANKGFSIYNYSGSNPLVQEYLIKIDGTVGSSVTNNNTAADYVEISYNILNDTSNSSKFHTLILVKNSSSTGLTIKSNTFYIGSNFSGGDNAAEAVRRNLSNTYGIGVFDHSDLSNLTIANNTFKDLAIWGEGDLNYTAAIWLTTLNISTHDSYIGGNRIFSADKGIVLGNHSYNFSYGGIKFGSGSLRITNNTFFNNNHSIVFANVVRNTENNSQNIIINYNNFTGIIGSAIAINTSGIASYFTGTVFSNESALWHPSNFTIQYNEFNDGGRGAIGSKAIDNSYSPAERNGVRELTLIAEYNYWDDATGPGYSGGGFGSNVTPYVDFSPWCTVNKSLNGYSNACVDTNNTIVNGLAGADGAGYYTKITDALVNASYGDIIEIGNGTYYGNWSINDGGLTIRAYETVQNVTILGNVTLQGTANNTVIGGTSGKGFHFSTYSQSTFGGEGGGGGIINIIGQGINTIEISYNTFNVSNTTDAGIVIKESNDTRGITIWQNTFYLNLSSKGVYIPDESYTSGLNITQNTFNGNPGAENYSAAIFLTSLNLTTSETHIQENTINYAHRGIVLGNKTTLDHGLLWQNTTKKLYIYNNTFYKNNISIDIVSVNPEAQNYTQNITIMHNNLSMIWNVGISINSTTTTDNEGSSVANLGGYLNSTHFIIYNNIFTSASGSYAINNSIIPGANLTAKYNWWGNTTHGSPGNEGGNGANLTWLSASEGGITYSPWFKYDNLSIHVPSNETPASSSSSSSSSSTGGGSAGSAVSWKMTYRATEEDLESGYKKELAEKHRVKFKIGENYHYAGITEITSSTASIKVWSEVQEATLSIGDTRRFDLDSNGYYDISITLNAIGKKADITIKKISEKVTVETEKQEEVKEEEAVEQKEEEKAIDIVSKTSMWVIIGIIIVLVVIGIGYKAKKKR